MYIKLAFLTFLGCGWLLGMEKESQSFLDLLPPDMKSQLRKFAPGHLELLPPDMQKAVVEAAVASLLRPGGRYVVPHSHWPQFMEYIIKPLRAYASDPVFLKNLDTIISITSQGSNEEAVRIAAALDLPEAIKWLKEKMAKDNDIRQQAQYQFYKIVSENLGSRKSRKAWHPEEKQTPEKEKEEQELKKVFYRALENLLKAGVDLNKPLEPYHKSTPIMAAAEEGDAQTVEFLLKHGADPKLKSKNPVQTALDRAEKNLEAARHANKEQAVRDLEETIKVLKAAL